ncbi:pro-cathepsin H-like [Saccoglossus kowalevskii]|uniref:Pro-cathepsin H-like n=1 Tax=Saccoglossus kowalevskii TaxID=10224 RepID=A0ABM0M0V7_SACKO|nr:PREDICTED: pro-cathepsin H-like [Saccoglossus kowalevskii]
MVKEHNSKNHTYTLAMNKFADMSFDEFRQQYLITAPQNCSATKSNHLNSFNDIPKAFDWTKYSRKVVTDVKSQGSCGSCWSFSTTGALESATAIAKSTLISLSEQQLIDCAQAFNNHGCNGGLPAQAFEYIHYNDGLMADIDYQYKAKDGKCKYDPSKAAAFVSKIVNITKGDEDGILNAVYKHGPVSIAYDVASDFHLYHSGVYSSTVCKIDPEHVNHAVLATGFNETAEGLKYWMVKNSWGPDWGLDGYFWIERNKNMCGLADCASYPIVYK